MTDSIKNIPLLADTDQEKILKFCMCVRGVYDQNLVMDFEFTSLLVSRTSGKTTWIFWESFRNDSKLEMVRSEIISTLLLVFLDS